MSLSGMLGIWHEWETRNPADSTDDVHHANVMMFMKSLQGLSFCCCSLWYEACSRQTLLALTHVVLLVGAR